VGAVEDGVQLIVATGEMHLRIHYRPFKIVLRWELT
jgi:hypothetical protein